MRSSIVFGVLLALCASTCAARPNILLIITDDQGWGDLGVHGNEKIHTPNIDRLARESAELTRFYVSPVCAPTRASLMTGRYNYRTCVIDTFQGRAIMHPDEVTLAEMLSRGGYRTGIFGKWHLGDHYPSRAMDQGFAESLVIQGGGLAQPSDPPRSTGYFDPPLLHNGKLTPTRGYCSDIFTDSAMAFIESARKAEESFFAYLAFNAPHTPLEVPEDLVKPYRDAGIEENTARLYAMISNIDMNVGRILQKLDELKLAENTLVIFMTDNGPQQPRYNGVLRNLKGSVYDGGIHVPFFIRWPAGFKGGRKIDRLAAHIDVMPTLLDASGIKPPGNLQLDGTSLMRVLREDELADWPDRTLCLQWHRGDVPDHGRNCTAVSQRYKLVQPRGASFGPAPRELKWELYDLLADPSEQHDLAASKPDVLATMQLRYDAWFKDVTSTRGFKPLPSIIGAEHENPVLLTRQDLRQQGYWPIRIAKAGTYRVTFFLDSVPIQRTASVILGEAKAETIIAAGTRDCTFAAVTLAAGEMKLTTSVNAGERKTPAPYVQIELIP